MSQIFRKVSTGISFSKGKPVLDIFSRDVDNKRHVVKVFDLPVYFYVRETEQFEEEDKKKIIKEQFGFRSLFGENLKKVYVKKISDCRKLGKIYHGFESDLKWDKKMLLDLQLTDKFLYHEGKVYTLDKRFNVLNEKDVNVIGDEINAVSVIQVNQDVKDLVSKALEIEDAYSKIKPKYGNYPYEVRHVVFDIEVIVEKKEDLRTKNGNIVCVCLYDSYTGVVTKLKNDMSERVLVKKVLEYFKEVDCDVITGWNVEFDMGWIIEKAMDYDMDLSVYFPGGKTFISKYTDPNGKYRENFNIGGRALVDAMELYKKKTMTTEKLASYSLKAVNLAEGFEEYEDFGARVNEMWDKDPDVVVEYCAKDVMAVVDISKKKDLLNGALTICKFYGCAFSEVTTNSIVIESMLFLLKGNRVLPNVIRGREKADIIGAKVLKSTYGLHKGVGIFDAASLYPSIIQGLNISPECLVPGKDLFEDKTRDCIHVDLSGVKCFMLKKDVRLGLMTEVIMEMRKLRETIRSKREQAVRDGDDAAYDLANNEEKVAKGVLASVYGVMGFSEFRLFNADCANMITAVARGMIYTILDKLNEADCKIIYGDTDSVFVKLPNADYGFNVMDKMNEIAFEYVKSLGVEERVINMNYEKYFRWVMFNKIAAPKLKSKLYKKDKGTAKKKYIGYISHVQSGPREMKEVNDMYYKGFELRRSDSAKVLKVVMKKFFELMVDGDYMKSVDYLREVKNEFSSYDKDYIAMPRSVNVEDANDPWANGLRYSKTVLGFEFDDDTMPKLLYVKPNYKYEKTNVICYQDGHVIPESFEIDYDVMYDKLIKKKFEPIVESLGLFWDTAINNQGVLDAWV